jgi:thiamine biosynthesis lipoprotein
MLARARPWLGTLVEIRVAAAAPGQAQNALEAGFAAIADIHRHLSFHDATSELSQLNRRAWREVIPVSASVAEVLRNALHLAEVTEGVFDPSIGGCLVQAGALPRPGDTPAVDTTANWTDVHIDAANCVHFRKPLWLDFGGIAKGYAVDRAIAALRENGATSAVVNAGGDLAAMGEMEQIVAMRAVDGSAHLVEIGALRKGAAAGSACGIDAANGVVHFDAATRKSLCVARAVTVFAPHCVWADALTKLVLRDPQAAQPVLEKFGAGACVLEADAVHTFGIAA